MSPQKVVKIQMIDDISDPFQDSVHTRIAMPRIVVVTIQQQREGRHVIAMRVGLGTVHIRLHVTPRRAMRPDAAPVRCAFKERRPYLGLRHRAVERKPHVFRHDESIGVSLGEPGGAGTEDTVEVRVRDLYTEVLRVGCCDDALMLEDVGDDEVDRSTETNLRACIEESTVLLQHILR